MSADWLFKVGFNSAVEAAAYRYDWAGTFLREVGAAINAACVCEAVFLGDDPWNNFGPNISFWEDDGLLGPYQFGDERA